MHVTRLRLKNIRLFEELDINFGSDKSSILIIGDNGDGKSTILRSLAMGLCDQSSASALFRELPGEYVNRDSKDDRGTITVDLAGRGAYTYRIITTIIRVQETFERVEQHLYRFQGKRQKELTQDDFPWQRIFASGYGAGIRTQGTADFDYYLTADALYPLFRYDVPLQNPELVVRRLVDEARGKTARGGEQRAAAMLKELEELLRSILQLEGPGKINLTATGIEVVGAWGTSELSSLGDGYRATLTWVLDLIAWWFLQAPEKRAQRRHTDIRGIVMVDEIEQHLHPKWQRNILRLLTEAFPHVQFIATTHSPLVASGCDGITVHLLSQGGHTTVEPYGWLAEDVYRAMGLPSSRAASFGSEIKEFQGLHAKHLSGKATKSDNLRLKSLRLQMEALPSSDSVGLFTELSNIRQRLEQSPKKRGSKT